MRARWVYRTSLAVLSAAAALNVAVAISVYRRAASPVAYNVRIVEPPQAPSLDLSPLPLPGTQSQSPTIDPPGGGVSSSILSTPRRWAFSFQYFESGGRPGVMLNGRPYYVGDVHAFGVVSSIFPERIYFQSGDFIDNERKVQNEPIGNRPAPVSP